MRFKRIQHEIYLQALLRDQELTKQSAELSAKLIDNIIIRSQKKTIKLLLAGVLSAISSIILT